MGQSLQGLLSAGGLPILPLRGHIIHCSLENTHTRTHTPCTHKCTHMYCIKSCQTCDGLQASTCQQDVIHINQSDIAMY